MGTCRDDAGGIPRLFDRGDQRFVADLPCLNDYLELVMVQAHLHVSNAFKPIQGLLDRIRSGHSDDPGLGLLKAIDVDQDVVHL
jgi:hypothetical protein